MPRLGRDKRRRGLAVRERDGLRLALGDGPHGDPDDLANLLVHLRWRLGIDDEVELDLMRSGSATSLLERLEEEIPAKWLREVERIFAAGHMPVTDSDDPAIADEPSRTERRLAAVETLPD